MASKRRSRAWWSETVERYKRSGLTAQRFAKREGLSAGTLGWWSSQLSRGTRAKRGSVKAVPLEVRLPRALPSQVSIEVEVAGAVVRLPAGTSPEYVASLLRSVGQPR